MKTLVPVSVIALVCGFQCWVGHAAEMAACPIGQSCEAGQPNESAKKAFAKSSIPTPKGCLQLEVKKLPGEHDLQKAMDAAKAANKFLFIQYGRENCTLCQKTWNMLGSGAVKLPDNFMYADVSCDDDETAITFEENFSLEDGGYYYPYLVIVAPNGRQINSCSGAQLPETLQQMIQQAVSAYVAVTTP